MLTLTFHNTAGVKARLQKILAHCELYSLFNTIGSLSCTVCKRKKACNRRTNKKVRQEQKLRIVKDERGKRVGEGEETVRNQVSRVWKANSPRCDSIWPPRSARMCVCVCQRVEKRQSDKRPCILYVFMCVSMRLHMCVSAHLWLLVLHAYSLCMCVWDVFLWQHSEDRKCVTARPVHMDIIWAFLLFN